MTQYETVENYRERSSILCNLVSSENDILTSYILCNLVSLVKKFQTVGACMAHANKKLAKILGSLNKDILPHAYI